MADIINPHDKYFRSTMQDLVVATQFFNFHLPQRISGALDFDAMTQQPSSYIDESLSETVSDLVFSCPYNTEVVDGAEDEQDFKIVLLVEHQSSPDKLMAFRVFHYMFNMLHNELKQQSGTCEKLPAVYAMVFYHGKQTPYPYSLDLKDCFDDPLEIMQNLFENPVSLVDLNQIEDDEIRKQQMYGIMASALKHSRDRDISRFLTQLFEDLNSMDFDTDLALNFMKRTVKYTLNVGNAANVRQFIKSGQHLPEPVRGEVMTIAEKLRAMGAEEGREEGRVQGREEGREEVAISLLKDGAEPRFVARIAKLELAVVLKLKAELDNEKI